ncbi:hypothetical protein DXG03_005866 [Asterophora parasitica]|uniref:Uncharacterized protein n=1 Tax=Asterophora parasitica TaxID=117018 RepID=A0A9P7FZJ4_9AGAR|nr:hypothetical protein DXG03_005866 [Asterophora parasitica]
MAGMVSIPNVNYRQVVHPYNSHGQEKRRSLRYAETVHDPERLLEQKAQLRLRLNSGKLSNMPSGFPFSARHGYSGVTYDSYEFREELTGAAHRANSRHQFANITFENATSSRDGFIWQAHLPGAESYLRGGHSKPTAHVQVDLAVSRQESFWLSLHKDPLVILRALGISLELGCPITIQPASNAGVVYMVTHKDGRQEPYFILRT